MNKIEELRREIEALEAQKKAKEQELHQLRGEQPAQLDFNTRDQRPSAVLQPEAKIALFLELFGARRDVYPKFWENPSFGKKGYSPACGPNYEAGASDKRYIPLDERIIERDICAAIVTSHIAPTSTTAHRHLSVGSGRMKRE